MALWQQSRCDSIDEPCAVLCVACACAWATVAESESGTGSSGSDRGVADTVVLGIERRRAWQCAPSTSPPRVVLAPRRCVATAAATAASLSDCDSAWLATLWLMRSAPAHTDWPPAEWPLLLALVGSPPLRRHSLACSQAQACIAFTVVALSPLLVGHCGTRSHQLCPLSPTHTREFALSQSPLQSHVS